MLIKSALPTPTIIIESGNRDDAIIASILALTFIRLLLPSYRVSLRQLRLII